MEDGEPEPGEPAVETTEYLVAQPMYELAVAGGQGSSSARPVRSVGMLGSGQSDHAYESVQSQRLIAPDTTNQPQTENSLSLSPFNTLTMSGSEIRGDQRIRGGYPNPS